MKHNEITDVMNFEKIPLEAMENLFNIYLNEDNEYYYNIMRTVNIEGLDNIDMSYFETYIYKEQDSWTVLSYKFYGTTRLWWLICKVNNIFNPFERPVEGTKIIYLKPEVVNNIVLRRIQAN